MEIINDLYWFEENGVHTFEGSGHHRNFILMQYTGIKDSKGVEIYEGDIVAVTSVEYPDECATSDIFFSNDTAFSVRSSESDYDIGLSLTWGGWSSIEVIGNIYENPELIENKL